MKAENVTSSVDPEFFRVMRTATAARLDMHDMQNLCERNATVTNLRKLQSARRRVARTAQAVQTMAANRSYQV